MYIDYGNFEKGQTREYACRSIDHVEPRQFTDNTVLRIFTNLFKHAGYTYIIVSLRPLIILILLLVIALNTLMGKKLNKIGYEYQPIITRFSRRYTYKLEEWTNTDL